MLRAFKSIRGVLRRRKAIARAQRYGSKEAYTLKEWKWILARDGYQCLRCHSRAHLVPDHVLPLVRGGRNHVSNLQTLCWKCNAWKSTKFIDFRNPHKPRQP